MDYFPWHPQGINKMEPPYTQRSGVPLQTRPVLSPFNPSALQSLSSILPRKKNGISITVHDHFASKRYRPGSIVKGTVDIKPKKSTTFTSISIKLVCDSSVERPNGNLSFETWHRLLELEMPIDGETLPSSKILQPNQTYTIPFYFVLPNSLGTEACSHNVLWQEVRQLHSQLPPTLNGWERDAMVSRGVCIEYGIIAQVWNSACPEYAKLEAKETIQFLPGFVEHPTLKIPDTDRVYKFESSKQLKTNVFARSSGQITLSACQPNTLVLDTIGRGFQPLEISTSLSLESSGGKSVLPQKAVVSAKIESQMWSQDEPMQQFPHIVDARDCYVGSETLLKKLEVDLSWEKEAMKRIGTTTAQAAEAFSSRVEIPLQNFMSDKKMFLPTFYSCLAARTYQLHITIVVASVTLKLVLPIQLSVEDPQGTQNNTEHRLSGYNPESSGLLPSYNESERRHSRAE
ncbi:Ff.00g003690.m01.CDS01 [Fusarium sp. VM40]|nr:Ff.00g003690.m01.CDS01 [Fusarium sp. VM40]